MESQELFTWQFILLVIIVYTAFLCSGMFIINSIYKKETKSLEEKFLKRKSK